MKHLKYFSLFESKTHNLPLPKNQSELDSLEKSPGFQKLKTLSPKGYRKTGCELVIMRNGGVEIISPVNYNFKVSPTGNFYYGGIQVGPRHGINLDTWDKLFDYVYLYFLGTGLNVSSSDSLENFVFNGVINSTIYSGIKHTEYFGSILEMARKYLGSSADEAIDKASEELSMYINDPAKVLETPAYKFFDKIFKFNPEIGEDTIEINLDNETPFGLFKNEDLIFPRYMGSRISMGFPESIGVPSRWKVKVKTMNGLNKSLLKEIIGNYENSRADLSSSSFRNRAGNLSVAISDILLKIFKICIDKYMEGKDIPDLNSQEDLIRYSFYNWGEDNESYIRFLVGIINTGKFDSVAKEIAYSQKTIDVLNSLKSEDSLVYSKVMRDIEDVPFIKDSAKDLYSSDSGIIKGGSMLRRFRLGGDDED